MSVSAIAKTEKKINELLPKSPEGMAVTLFVIAMASYYLWRMFAISPNYDELYTFYYFISKGPLYSAVHWPLPNNHVGYSILSSMLYRFGNSYIALRGVSYVAAIANLILVYRICRKYYSHAIPFGAVVLYASMQIVNDYSVLGRGYTLATTCFLLSIYYIGYICRLGTEKKSYYFLFGGTLVLGMYIVPSSIYWVVPVWASGAIFLFINAMRSKGVYSSISENIYYGKLRKLLDTAVVSMTIVILLYMIIWLAIGSNILVTSENSGFFELSHFSVIMKAPHKAILTGMRYMISHSYIQKLSLPVFGHRIWSWFMSLLNSLVPKFSIMTLLFLLISLGCLFYECFKHFEYSRTVINLVVIVNLMFLGIVLLSLRTLPYLRVFGYIAFVIVLCVCTALERLINVSIRLYNRRKLSAKGFEGVKSHEEIETVEKGDKWYSGIGVYIPVIVIVILFIFRFFDPGFSCQIAERENNVFNTLYVAEVTKRQSIAVLDCDQQYLLKFGWNIDCNKTDVKGADCVLLDKNMFNPNYNGDDLWKFYQTYRTIDWDYLSSMHVRYENDKFILYTK
ncbi:MAG: glycosyltransferase family 39 protein [Butyrivibrio sp.]|nr:glycosyltransferase family 39 protein [Butyrivibrio sp.]